MEDAVIYIDIKKDLISPGGVIKLAFRKEFSPGGIIALFGASGVGKTTILRMIAGLTKPDQGTIRFGNKVWFDSETGINLPPQKRNAGLMFQDYALFPNMTVEGNIRFAQEVSDPGMVKRLMNLFGLEGFAKQKTNKLSGGQKQRVALARALAHNPGILLLDEPFSALDYRMRLSLRGEIKKAYELKHTTMIIVSHDPAEIMHLADRIIWIENGSVTQDGEPAAVFGDIKMDFTAGV